MSRDVSKSPREKGYKWRHNHRNIETKKPAQSQGVLMAKKINSFDQVSDFWLGLNVN